MFAGAALMSLPFFMLALSKLCTTFYSTDGFHVCNHPRTRGELLIRLPKELLIPVGAFMALGAVQASHSGITRHTCVNPPW
jgi:hypothetical protein